MKSFVSLRVFLATGLLVLGGGSVTGWSAEPKATQKKSPQKQAGDTKAAETKPAADAPAEKRPPLKLAVDRKPINRDAADRVRWDIRIDRAGIARDDRQTARRGFLDFEAVQRPIHLEDFARSRLLILSDLIVERVAL